MKPATLKAILSELGLTQADFARLVGVTARAVNMWMMDERAIPGPAVAYARLLTSAPMSIRQIELGRLNERGTGMRDGMYGITFQGQQGAGTGMLVFDAGRVYGTDEGGAKYDGEYVFNDNTGMADIALKVGFPANVLSVLGISNPYEWAIDVRTSLDPKQNSGALAVSTSVGQKLTAQYKYLRGLPEAGGVN